MKYPITRTIFVDVDGTLIIRERLNQRLVDFCRNRKAEGFDIVLWSSQGKAHAQNTADRFEVAHIFDAILSKPGYIIDDKGWRWIQYTRVVRSLRRAVEAD